MKKTSTTITAMLLAAVLCMPATAASPPGMHLTSGEVQPGEAVTLTLSVENNPGLTTCLVCFYYDTSVFTVDPDADVATAGDFRTSGSVMANDVAIARERGVTYVASDKDGTIALWFNGAGEDTNGDGPLFQLTLHTADNAPEGIYAIEAVCGEGTINEALEDVSLSPASATVNVSQGAAVQEEPVPEPNAPGFELPAEESSSDVEASPSETSGDPDAETSTDGNSPVAGPVETTGDAPDLTASEGAHVPAVTAPVFMDVAGTWAESYIAEAARLNLMNGYEDGTYRPDKNMSRAEFATILWRAAGEPKPQAEASFTDLTQDWYRDAIAWAEETGTMNGVGDGKFDPNGNVTREQLATVLHRQAGSPRGMEMLLTSIYDAQYPDSDQIGEWAKPSLYWAIYSGIYCGESNTYIGSTLAPKAAATRAQIAVMIVRYMERQESDL